MHILLYSLLKNSFISTDYQLAKEVINKPKKGILKDSHPNREVIKLLFMLNSAEHKIVSANKYENQRFLFEIIFEIYSANKYENTNNSWHFHIY